MILCQPTGNFALYVTKLASNRVKVTWILYSANKLPKMYLVLAHHRHGEALRFQSLSLPQFIDIRRKRVVHFSALCTVRIYPPPPQEIFLVFMVEADD